jgi:hypothetical protein
MIDLGRKQDMMVLMAAVNDESRPLMQRRRAYRTCMSIKRKMSDKTISKLRLRLIAASIANDLPEIEKLGERLQEYERKHVIRKF